MPWIRHIAPALRTVRRTVVHTLARCDILENICKKTAVRNGKQNRVLDQFFDVTVVRPLMRFVKPLSSASLETSVFSGI